MKKGRFVEPHTPLVQSVTSQRYSGDCRKTTTHKTKIHEKTRDEDPFSPRRTFDTDGTMPIVTISIVLSRGFIIYPGQPLSKCIQHRGEDEGGIRLGRDELVLVLAVSLSLFSLILRLFSAVLLSHPFRLPRLHVELSPHSLSRYTLDEGCVCCRCPPVITSTVEVFSSPVLVTSYASD